MKLNVTHVIWCLQNLWKLKQEQSKTKKQTNKKNTPDPIIVKLARSHTNFLSAACQNWLHVSKFIEDKWGCPPCHTWSPTLRGFACCLESVLSMQSRWVQYIHCLIKSWCQGLQRQSCQYRKAKLGYSVHFICVQTPKSNKPLFN